MSVFVTGGQPAPQINYVEWIESTGAQYIKTGVYPTQSTRIEIEASDWSTSETSTALYGTQSASNDRYDLFVTTGGAYRTYYGGGWVGFDGGVDITDKSTVIRSGAVLTIDGVSVTNVEKTFTCTTELYLFAHNTNGSVSKQAALKLYSCKIYEGDTLLRDLRPCYDPEGVACLYDKVSKTYFYNAGSGSFTAGGAA